MAKLAFATFGVLKAAPGDPEVQGFVDRIPGVFQAAEHSEGFLARSERDIVSWSHSWGDTVLPEPFRTLAEGTDRLASSLSLWRDLESVAAYAYNGAHGEAMTKRREWFEPHSFPIYVAYWVGDDYQPSFEESAERLTHLHTNGPTAHAFNFRTPFDADGNPTSLNPAVVKARAAANSIKY